MKIYKITGVSEYLKFNAYRPEPVGVF